MPESSTILPPDSRQAIRREMRRRRRALKPREQHLAARQLDSLLGRQPLFQRSRHIAFYIASDGEIDPHHLLQSALYRGKRCYLPVLHPTRAGRLWFLPYTEETPLVTNHFGIAEPAVNTGRCMPATALDLVLLPLVAFDPFGARLGMGAGFYDRTFSFKVEKRRAGGRGPELVDGREQVQSGKKRHSPVLLGLAHSCQAVGRLPVEPWDIPLGAIATESGIVVCDDKASGRNFLRRDLLPK
jgi:5-formyltetrahydrofolate cyclo-ligase